MSVQANAFELRELSPHCRRCLALEEYRLLSDKHRHGVASAHVVRPYSPCRTNADSQIRRPPDSMCGRRGGPVFGSLSAGSVGEARERSFQIDR
jgi:hypothetical protein